MIPPGGEIKTVSLRILRDGPTHNHLLSPLTPYLAVVGPYEAVTVRVPYEHRRLLRDLNGLRYGALASRAPDPSRITGPDRRIIADEVATMFAAVPGLTSEIATEPSSVGTLTHLSLVFSAAELSLLPFELATAPRGFPGEGSPLSVQSVAPVVMTRAIPGATGGRCQWVGTPRILFAVAQPSDLPDVPMQAHLTALLAALRPWIGPWVNFFDRPNRRTFVERYLKVLPRATLREVEECCRTERITHVHILAHTECIEEGGQSQFALALHDAGGGKELVSAERLQAALRLPMNRRTDDADLSHPMVVTLASCDSGNQSQVVFPSMSLAHALHAAGVPLVVGSLFPLTYRGSVVMTETLYGGLLRGRDPRRVLYEMRHALFRMEEQTHDWASVVAYASLPDDIEALSQTVAYEASCAAVNAGLDAGQATIDAFSRRSGDARALETRLQQVDAAVESAANDLPVSGAYLLEGQGMVASTVKRRAELLWNASNAVTSDAPVAAQFAGRSRQMLEEARKLYAQAVRAPRWLRARPDADVPYVHWALTQVLSLTLVLERRLDWKRWLGAKLDANDCLDPSVDRVAGGRDRRREDVMWAHASLAELHLLAHGAQGDPELARQLAATLDGADAADEAKRHVRLHGDLARTAGDLKPPASTSRHLSRYTSWWFTERFTGMSAGHDPIGTRIVELAKQMIEALEGRG